MKRLTEYYSKQDSYITTCSEVCCEHKLIQIGEVDKPEWRESRRRIYLIDRICPTLHGIGCGGNTEPKIYIK